MTASITATGVTRRFGALTAVDSVDLSIPPGTLYGFLGRNGAGKTTLIRMLLGLIRPTAGQVSILGRAGGLPRRALRARGRMSATWWTGPGLYPELSPRDHLHLAATYRRVPRAACDDVVERLALGRYLDVRARALSQGNQQRLGLAMALLHRPTGAHPRRAHASGWTRRAWSRSAPCFATWRTAERRCSCPPTSSRRSRGWPTRSASSTRGGCSTSSAAPGSPPSAGPASCDHPRRTRARTTGGRGTREATGSRRPLRARP